MNSFLAFLFCRSTAYLLSGLAVVLAFLFPGPLSCLLLLGAGANLSLILPLRQRLQRIGLPLALIVCFLLAIPRPARALFGEDIQQIILLGKIWQEDVSMLAKLTLLAVQGAKLYENEKQKYDLAVRMSQAIKSKSPYTIQGAIRMGNAYVVDHYGESSGWNQAINLGTSVPLAYQHATLQQNLTGGFLAAERLGSSSHLAALARVGITDDTTQRAMSLAAQINQQQTTNAGSVRQWESSVLSHNADLNTAAAQQNLTNLGMVQIYEQGRANLAVHSILAQQLMLQNMKERDTAVADLNRWQRVAEYRETQRPAVGNIGQDLLNHQPY